MTDGFFTILIASDEALYLHEMIIARFGGAQGVRDMKLLESALDQPLKAIEYGNESEKEIAYLAATYFFHIIKNHAFVDGNKRTGLLIATTFFSKNGFVLDMGFEELYGLAIKTAESKLNKQEIAVYCFCMSPDSIIDAVYLGVHTSGDSDSIASLAGALAGAYNGVDQVLRYVPMIEDADMVMTYMHYVAENRHDVEASAVKEEQVRPSIETEPVATSSSLTLCLKQWVKGLFGK